MTTAPARRRPDQPYTVDELAARWRLSRMTVYRLCHSGELRAARIGRNFRIPADVVATFEKERGLA